MSENNGELIERDMIDAHILAVCQPYCAKHGRFLGMSVCRERQDEPGAWLDDEVGWWRCAAVLQDVGVERMNEDVWRCRAFQLREEPEKPKRKRGKGASKQDEVQA